MGVSTKTIAERFWPKVARGDGCWLWTAAIHRNGYGKFNIGGKILLAHRVAWSLAVGTVAEGSYICHHCDNPGCVRPDHLFIGTPVDNRQDSIKKGRDRIGNLKKDESEYYRPKLVPSTRNTENLLRGSECTWAKLTEEKVREIRRRYISSRISQRRLADEYKVSVMTINDVVHRRKWKHI